MMIFDCEEMSSATSTPQKDSGSCPCGEMTSCSTLKDLSTGFSFRSSSGDSVCEKADADVFDSEADVKCADSIQSGTVLLHDHSYTMWQPRKVSSASSDSSTGDLDESLQNLFDTCEIDREFLAEAKPAFRQFLDDVLDSIDVPATDNPFFFDLDDSCCRVPTRSASLSLAGPPSSPCLFTSAGSTDTMLSTSVVGLRVKDITVSTSSLLTSPMTSSSTSSPFGLPLPLFSSSSPLSSCSSAPSPFAASSSSSFSDFPAPSESDSSALDSKLKDVIEFLFNDNSCEDSGKESEVTSFLKEMDDVTCCGGQKAQQQQPTSYSDSDDFVWPVTVSHRIQNGVCVSCSVPQKQSEKNSEGLLRLNACDALPHTSNNTIIVSSATAAPAPAATQLTQSQQHHYHHHHHHPSSSSSSTTTATSTYTPILSTGRSLGKRKLSDSEESCDRESERCDKRARLEPCLDTDTDDTLSRVDLPTTSLTTTSPNSCCVLVDSNADLGVESANNLPLSLDLSEDAVVLKADDKVSEKRPEGVLDYLSFVRNTKLPLSPIHLHHFGRHG